MADSLKQHLVSVVIPAYNMAEFTVRTVESVLAQTYKNIEVIVVDDGSTDDTRQRLESYAGRITYILKKNGGACSARNAGIRRAQGKYIALLDCDDKYLPEKIELSVRYMEEHPDTGLLHTNAYYIDHQDKIIGKGKGNRSSYKGRIKDRLIVLDLIFNPTVVIRRECFDRAGLFDENLFPPADWDMWLRISEHYPFGYIDKPLSMYRISSNWNFRYMERVMEEEQTVLNNFFKRNAGTPQRIKDKAFSRFHFTTAKCYLVKEDYDAMKRHVMLAMALDPLNWKANIMFLGYLLNRQSIRRIAARSMFVDI